MIREAGTADLGSLVELCVELHGDSDNSVFELDEEKMRVSLSNFILSDDMQILVYDCDGDVVGVHGGVVYSDWFTNDFRADSFLIYVAKRARGGLAAKSMLKRYEEWALSRGAKSIMVGFGSGAVTDRMFGLLERLGYERRGALYRKEE